VTEGKNGVKVTVYNDYYVDGVLSRTEVVSDKITKKPVNKVLNVGTKPNPTPTILPTGRAMSEIALPADVKIGRNGLPENYRSVINAKATAYSGGGITSTGKGVKVGYIAVDPNEIPYGTEMYIVSADGRYVYGYCIAADTGSFIYDVDWTVDLYMNSESQCIQWGRRDIIIYVL
ncbi:MAG: 3D domain-containing protein, partial [Clostridia bacterium]|nr:3D domain-containing protein [Clostridia bacterium]